MPTYGHRDPIDDAEVYARHAGQDEARQREADRISVELINDPSEWVVDIDPYTLQQLALKSLWRTANKPSRDEYTAALEEFVTEASRAFDAAIEAELKRREQW